MRGVLVLVALAAAAPTSAHASTYALRARTYAQVYQLRGYRLVGEDVWVARRRFGQALSLTVWDVGDLEASRRRQRRGGRGPTVTWRSHLALEHDFGAFAAGRVSDGGRTVDALDAIPELDDATLALTLSYGYLEATGLVDDRLSLRAGRLVALGDFDAWMLDGVEARAEVARRVWVAARAGLRVRDASPLAGGAGELDGTSGAECQEYVEGAAPGQGRWQLIDRSAVVAGARLSSDAYLCPQRRAWQPTIGVEVTATPGPIEARLSYRRTQSRTVGRIGAIDRLDYPDLGLYPDEFGQAPAWGVNDEHLAAMATGRARAGAARLEPWILARHSLVHARIDRAGAGVAVRFGAHRLEPEVSYAVPTFDADSIFAVFAVEPSTDVRMAWTRRGPTQVQASAWARAYHGSHDAAWAWGGDAAVERPVSARLTSRLGAIVDGGYGGRRIAGRASLRWARRGLELAGHAALWRIDPDDLAAGDAAASWAVVAEGAATMALGDGAALHATVDGAGDRFTPLSVRTLVVLDLAFATGQGE